MTDADGQVTVAQLLRFFKDDFELTPIGSWDQKRPISHLVFAHEVNRENTSPNMLVLFHAHDDDQLAEVLASWPQPAPVALVTGPLDASTLKKPELQGHALITAAEGFNIRDFILGFSRWIDPAETALARKLAAIQGKFNLALTHSDPLQDLFRRVGKQLGGTVALIDNTRRIHASSGPLPMSQIMPALEGNAAPQVRITTDRWNGSAVRVSISHASDEKDGWLIGLVPAPHRFESVQLAALQLAVPLFDTILALRDATLEQERSISAALLNEALAFKPQRQDSELQGKLLGSGIAFKEDLHVIVIQPRSLQASTARRQLKQIEPEFKHVLDAVGIRNLVTEKDQQLVALVEANVSDLKRVLVSAASQLSEVRAGVGRSIYSVADIAASYQDGMLALRMDATSSNPRTFVASEDFDYALRLFSEVGLDRVIDWANSLFEPIREREALLLGVQAFFAADQNINAAAEALNIHHNSLRYRLAKAEEALNLSLRSPSAIASIYLGLTALELGNQIRPFSARSARTQQIATGETVTSGIGESRGRPTSGSAGVVLSGEH